VSESVLDFAGLETQVSTETQVETPEVTQVETPETTTTQEPTETTTTTEPKVEGAEKKQLYNSDGSPKEEVKKEEPLPGGKNTPDSIRRALKMVRDANPQNKGLVKELHDGWERSAAYAKEFPTVQEARNAKSFIELVGGPEGYEKLNQTVENIKASDQLLYNGDATLLDNIIEDLKSEGRIDAFGKLAAPFLDKLRDLDRKSYNDTVAPHILSNLESANLPGALAGLVQALNDPDPAKAVAAAKEIAQDMNGWYNKIKQEHADKLKAAKAEPTPEQLKFQKEREEFTKQKQEFEKGKQTEFQNAVASVLEKSNNQLLGKSLGPYLKMAYFKEFPRTALVDLGNGIKNNLYQALKANKDYQRQMGAMWKEKSPNKDKIKEYHDATVEGMAEDVVRQTIETRYPGYAKGGQAATRVAAAATKTAAVNKADATAVVTGKPQYVAEKPKNLNREMDPKSFLEIAGKGYVPDGKGGHRFVTWRKV
jgi:hypothetical protein